MNKNGYVAQLFLSGLFISSTVFVFGQTTTDTVSGIDELSVKPIRLPSLQEVGGSPFMTADYQTGIVKVTDEKMVPNVPVKFNIYSNAIMVQKEGQDMRLESFKLDSYDETANNGIVKHVMFSQGYPEIDNHTDKSVYQVLSIGPKAQLLKFLSQKVEDAPTLGDYSRREIVTIKRIKASKQSVVEALPSLSAQINEVITAKNLNLKNESDIAELVEVLNTP